MTRFTGKFRNSSTKYYHQHKKIFSQIFNLYPKGNLIELNSTTTKKEFRFIEMFRLKIISKEQNK